MKKLVGVVFVILCAAGAAAGATWYVDDSVVTSGDGKTPATALKTIQKGIDAASHGDTVIVAEGTYRENVKFKGKNIVLTSTDRLSATVVANTIIDGNQSWPVVSLAGREDETSVLSGFTIRNGKSDYGAIRGGTEDQRCLTAICNNVISGNSGDWGGGILYCNGNVEDNTISGNSAVSGAGLYGCDGVVRNNTITGNSSRYGGALYACHGHIQNNVISDNSAEYEGGGFSWCNGTIEGNTISRNSGGEYGGALVHCNGTIRGNVIAGNTATYGGGLYYCAATLQNNLIVGNSAWDGGGLYRAQGTIQNNTIYGNVASSQAGGLYECNGPIANCIIWGNAARTGAQIVYSLDLAKPRYCCIEGWTGGGEGNIANNPLLVDAAGPDNETKTYADNDYHLRSDSPCIDAGTHETIVPPNTDMEGEWRPFGREIDIGADECVDADQDDLPDYWEIDWFGTLWVNAEDDVDADGLPNGQEFLCGTDPENPDSDVDGKSDGDEVFAGTDPLDLESLFRVIEIVHTSSGTALRWSAVPTRSYQCYFSSSLKGWKAVGGIITAGPSDTSLSVFDSSSAAVRRYYYKVEVLP